MFLSDFSIKRPIAMIVIIIALMCLGLLALKNLKVNQIPDVQQPVMVINIPYPGASPETVEREIINRIEKSLQSITGVYQIRATASEGEASIVIIFNFKKNMVEASDEIRNAIAAVRYKLPLEMREPVLQRIDPSAGAAPVGTPQPQRHGVLAANFIRIKARIKGEWREWVAQGVLVAAVAITQGLPDWIGL